MWEIGTFHSAWRARPSCWARSVSVLPPDRLVRSTPLPAQRLTLSAKIKTAADDVIPFLKFLTKKKRDRPKVKASVEDSVITSNGFLAFSTSESNLGGSSTVDGANSLAESETSADIEDQNSKRAVWFSWGIASIGTLLGNIDHITPILTMFYLMMYGGINLCCFLLAWVDSPGFRPQ